MHYSPESLKSEGMLAVEITENDRQQSLNAVFDLILLQALDC